MISPTPRAIALMVLGVPVMLFVAVAAPGLWVLSAGWISAVAGLMLVDAALGARIRAFEHEIDVPRLLYIQEDGAAEVAIRFAEGALPHAVLLRLEVSETLAVMATRRLTGFQDRTHRTRFALTPLRRGEAALTGLWARWQGPLGFVNKQVHRRFEIKLAVTPNTRWVKEEAIRLYARDADFGIKTQLEMGDGSEFDALRDFTSGMDRRALDWKHSARHRKLLAKEFRTERNHQIVFAFDTGRLMSEPMGGVPKIDRAINAALLLAYVSLRSGDKAMLYGFDARPGLLSGHLTGTHAFPQVEALAAGLAYSTEDANYTLALSELQARLNRRSLIILFTDFVDTISAELMLENVRRLTDRHLVLFATFEDEITANLIDRPPETPRDVARAVIADTLAQERELVFRKLQRLGAQIIETRPERFGGELVSRYLEIKRRELL